MVELFDATALHRVRRRLYRVAGHRLLFPVTGAQALAAVLALVVARTVTGVVGLAHPITGGTVGLLSWAVPNVGPAAAAWWAAGRETVEGRSPVAWCAARIAFLALPARVVVG